MQPDMQACSPAARVCRRPAIDYFYLWTRPKKRSTAFPKVSRRILIGKTSLPLSPFSTLENFRGLCCFSKANRTLVYTRYARQWKLKFIPMIGQTIFLSFYYFSWIFYIGINKRFREVSRFVQAKISRVFMFTVSSFSISIFGYKVILGREEISEETKKYEILFFQKRIELYLSFKIKGYDFTICVIIPLLFFHDLSNISSSERITFHS